VAFRPRKKKHAETKRHRCKKCGGNIRKRAFRCKKCSEAQR